MVELAPTCVYMPRFLPPGTADMAFISAKFCARAARLTDRCSDHATSPRHRSTQAPRKPRIAPTQMKTVPSGRSDFCMNKARDVSGTCWLGIPTPARVGRPESPTMVCATVGKSPELSAVAAVVPDDAALVCAVVESALDVAAVVGAAEDAAAVVDGLAEFAADDAAAVDDAPCPSGCWIVDSCGRLLLLLLLLSSCARTAGAAASSRPTRPTERRMAGCVRGRMEVCCELGDRGARFRGAAWAKSGAESCGQSCLRAGQG